LNDSQAADSQRWQELVGLAADLAFETDREGRFTFISPAQPLGWLAEELLGRPCDCLLAQPGVAGFNPFRSEQALRAQRVWLRRPDGATCWMSVSVNPLHDAAGALIGARGAAQDLTNRDTAETTMARALRRSELLDYILWEMRSEMMAPRMMARTLQALAVALNADGVMILEGEEALRPLGAQGNDPLLDEVGGAPPGLSNLAATRLAEGITGPVTLRGPGGHDAVLCATATRFEGWPGVLAWRQPGRRVWDGDELSLLGTAVDALRIVLEHRAIQRELAGRARIDALTGLHNHRAFAEELDRRIDRLDVDGLPGTLMYIDLDRMKAVNQTLGAEAGDDLLCRLATLLRTATRPADLLARLGADKFALWMDGMDDLAGAERADRLCRTATASLAAPGQTAGPSLCVGVASRWPGRGVDGATLLRRAEAAMRRAKHTGAGAWKVWRSDSDADV
jgi:diguanylate cyclase (GGDEF)-like protein/PAS domain S-box-containing protein